MMWQMQMASPQVAMPWGHMPMVSAILNVRVEGLKFDYQLTKDDVLKVFSRYGEVFSVQVDREGTSATVQFEQPQHALSAQHDLDRKHLAGMSNAFLRVDFASQPYDATFVQMAATAAQNFSTAPMLPMGYPPIPQVDLAAAPPVPAVGHPKKYTCKLEVGIENEGEFRVGSRVIQIARQIWQDPKFQESGGKTRLRGKGVGGPHEADEPLALCISCRDQACFEKAVQIAEAQLQKVHSDYKTWCQQKGRAVPELAVKVSRKGANYSGRDLACTSDPPRGERPSNAPTDEEIERLIEERNEARKAAIFKKSDEIREFLRQRGVVLMDEKGAKGNFRGNEVTKWRFWRP